MILKSLYEWSLFGHYLDWILWSPWTSKIGIQKAGGPLFSWWWDTYTLIRILELRTSSELQVGNSITSHLFRQACEITCFKFCSVIENMFFFHLQLRCIYPIRKRKNFFNNSMNEKFWFKCLTIFIKICHQRKLKPAKNRMSNSSMQYQTAAVEDYCKIFISW